MSADDYPCTDFVCNCTNDSSFRKSGQLFKKSFWFSFLIQVNCGATFSCGTAPTSFSVKFQKARANLSLPFMRHLSTTFRALDMLLSSYK